TFIQLEFRDPDPARAAAVLAAIMDRSVELAGGLKRSKLDEQTEVLDEQVQLVEADLREAERQLESFRVQTITLPTDQSSAIAPGLQQTRAPALDDFFSLRTELEEL